MAAREGIIDVLYNQHKMREQRPNMVDNNQQYKLVHLVLLECLLAPETSIACDQNFVFKVEQILKNNIQEQLDYLENSMWKDRAMQVMMTEDDDGTIEADFSEKNRFQEVVPGTNRQQTSKPYFYYCILSRKTRSYFHIQKSPNRREILVY